MKKYILPLLLALIICTASACSPAAEPESIQTPAPENIQTDEPEIVQTAEPESIPEEIPQPSPMETDISPIPPALIAHAGGSIYGYRLTNSLEALDTAYANGFRYIEMDFECTSDGQYVLLHDWTSMAQRMLFTSGQRTLSEFQSAEVFMDLTQLDLDALLEWLESHRDCFIITDAKCGNEPFLAALSEKAEKSVYQFIPQAYSYDDYTYAKECGFDSVILTLYLMDSVDENELAQFAQDQQPWAITIPAKHLTESLLRSLDAVNTCTYTHTVNDLSYYEQWHDCGLHGIYTDYFTPSKWPY